MGEHECIIGLYYADEYDYLTTLKELKEEIKDNNERVDNWEKEFIGILKMKKKSINDYCDRRKSTNITHFNYCPFCGKEINWKEFKE